MAIIKHIYQNINRMNKSIKEKKESIFKTNSNLENNSNRIPTTINKANTPTTSIIFTTHMNLPSSNIFIIPSTQTIFNTSNISV